MPFENNNSNEQIKIDPSKQQEQIDRDFDAILKEYQNMSHKEQGDFIEAVANKDPHFKELYTQLKVFFQDRVMTPENYDNHLKLEAVKKHIEGTELDNSKNEKITLEPNIDDLATLKAKFYRTGPDNELHSKYFTIANGENQKLTTIKSEFDNWIIRAREYIDNKYQAYNKVNNEVEEKQEDTVKNDTNLENSESINLSEKEVKELTDLGNKELQKNNEQNEKIEKKLLQLSLIQDISLMYKEYLESILGNIKFKIISDKDERYENQINIIENEVRNITNLTEYLNLLGNTDDLLDINAEKLLNKLIVSEEKIAETGGFDQPISFLWNKNDSVEGVNNGYKQIRKILSNPNISTSDIANIKINIFNTIRSFDGLDDDKHRYNTSEGIRTRITNDILYSKELREDSFIKDNFDLINSIGEKSKLELYNSLNLGKDSLKSFFESKGLFEKVGIYNSDDKFDLLENIYDSLKEGEDNIDDNKLKEKIKDEVNSKIQYLEKEINDSDNKEEIYKKINELKNSILDDNINKLVENIKIETIFKSFERIVIFQTLEKKSELVKKLSKQNNEIELYRDIEGIGNKLSDDTFNSISTGTQFLAEQIAIMFISGGAGNLVLKGFQAGANTGKVTNLLKGGMNAKNIGKISANIGVEATTFYGTYSALNGITNNENLAGIQDSMNMYDWGRTIAFLGILRAFSKTSNAFTIKNISLDTRNILGTDLVIRGISGLIGEEEGIEGIDFKNKEIDIKKLSLFLADELAFILPLVIGLGLSNKAFGKVLNDIKNGNAINTPKIEVIPTQKEFIIKIEGLQKEIRILKQSRNILRNKGKDTSEINTKLQNKKAEYKVERNINPELVEQNNILKQEKLLNNQPLQTTEPTINKKDDRKVNSEEDVNTPTGNSPKYERLAKYSEKAKSGKLDYVLKDEVIGDVLSVKGIGKNGESVGEGLLKKSGFKEGEKLEPKNKFEKDAVKQMERANLEVYKQFDKIKGLYDKGNLNNLIFHLKGIGIDKKTFNDKLLPILKKN